MTRPTSSYLKNRPRDRKLTGFRRASLVKSSMLHYVEPTGAPAKRVLDSPVGIKHPDGQRIASRHLVEEFNHAEVEVNRASFGELRLLWVSECSRAVYPRVLSGKKTGQVVRSFVVADEIDHGAMALAGVLAQSAPELLQEDYVGLCGAQEHHRVKRWYVDALIKHVHCKDRLEVAALKLGDGSASVKRVVCAGLLAVNGRCRHAACGEEVGHAFRVPNGGAEGQGAFASQLRVMLEYEISALLRNW